MLRNWITQFGYTAGRWAGDEPLTFEERSKFISQIGNFLGWNPPPATTWSVEVTKNSEGKYVFAFMRYATEDEAKKLLGNNYENTKTIQCNTNTCHADQTIPIDKK